MAGQLFTPEQNAIVKAPAFTLIVSAAASSASSATSKVSVASPVGWMMTVSFMDFMFSPPDAIIDYSTSDALTDRTSAEKGAGGSWGRVGRTMCIDVIGWCGFKVTPVRSRQKRRF